MFIKSNFIYFLIIYISPSHNVRNDIEVVESGVKEVHPRTVGLQLYSVLNNTSNQDYFVELSTDQCCIDSGENLDCDSLEIIGECSQVIQKGDVKAFTMIAPILDSLHRKGYCYIHLDSRPIDKRNAILRDIIKINFDTGVEINNANFKKLVNQCKGTDLDPFNDCKPVNCDTYYNGKKPLFDKHKKRCSEAPKCDNEIFDPISDRCVADEAIRKDDIDYIKRKVKRDRNTKDVVIVEMNTPLETSTETLLATEVLIDKQSPKGIVRKIITNKYTIAFMVAVIFLQCCFMCSMVYCLAQKSIDKDEKPVERKYFNYRQDVSVTTPLIATSNIDTETTLDYVSESKMDNRIRCYKACQKKIDDTKIAMSDDILSKCLTRRDWNSKPKSETHADQQPPIDDQQWKSIDARVEKKKASVQIEEKPTVTDSHSERLIQCHDYNIRHDRLFRDHKDSMSTDKEAQACFSNDSVDDFLSETGLTFLAGESISKKSMTSTISNSEVDGSSKTSKHNMLRNKISSLFKRSKGLMSSDPGLEKSSEKSLKLIHMSQATVLSSSGSGYRRIIHTKYPKESRSSIF